MNKRNEEIDHELHRHTKKKFSNPETPDTFSHVF